jgi:hypothetical protein
MHSGVTVDHSVFDAILLAHVRDEFVDYKAIHDSQLNELGSYLDLLAIVDPARLSRNEQLAYAINVYNATLINAIAQRNHAGFSVADDGFVIFKEPIVRMKSGAISLIDLRDRIIRPAFKDPRVHVALFTGAVSSHPIPRRSYHGDDVDRVLEENMKFFVTDRARNPIDELKRMLALSQIFNWNADDFGGKDAIAAYVSKYAGRSYERFAVSFAEYDWTLNEPQW